MLSVGKSSGKESFGTTSTDVLLYFYYGGCLMCGTGAWTLAVDLFRTCLVLPGASVSAVQVEAFKKLCIADVMAHGEKATLTLPSATNAAVAKVLALPAVSHYKTLAQEVASCAPPARVADHITCHTSAYTADGNWALVQALASFGDRLRLRKLTRVYASLPLEEAARRAGLASAADAARMLTAMVSGVRMPRRLGAWLLSIVRHFSYMMHTALKTRRLAPEYRSWPPVLHLNLSLTLSCCRFRHRCRLLKMAS